MKITIDYEITGCGDCPCLKLGNAYDGGDGRSNRPVYKCDKGVFGGTDSFNYDTGLSRKPKVPPYGCPYFKVRVVERVASKLNIDVRELEKILLDEHCILKEL